MNKLTEVCIFKQNELYLTLSAAIIACAGQKFSWLQFSVPNEIYHLALKLLKKISCHKKQDFYPTTVSLMKNDFDTLLLFQLPYYKDSNNLQLDANKKLVCFKATSNYKTW